MSGRDDDLDRLRRRETWDVVVIGGGATGLGAAVDAASRGLTTLVVDSGDFASGTSSRSTKLVHGGVRYLAQGNVALVREALRERGRLFRNAPHVVHDREFLVPAYRLGAREYYGLGLWTYDRLAGRLGIGRSHLVGADEARRLIPTIEPAHLRGGVVYHDGQFDDARLAMALVRTVGDLGGVALNYLGVAGLHKDASGRVSGVGLVDAETGEPLDVVARVVINATGVFADAIRKQDDPGAPPMIRASQGSHVVLDRSFLPGETALMVPKTDDGRVMFAIPWLDRVVIGTTDTPVSAVSLEPRATADELEFLLTHAGRYLTRDPSPADVRSVFTGLRPLVSPPRERNGSGPTSRISREHAVFASASGLVTITGGKWTTYRKMGEDAVNLAVETAGLSAGPSATHDLRLHGWVERLDPSDQYAAYGSDAAGIRALVAADPGLAERLHPALPYDCAEVVWAARMEKARSAADVLARRTRALFLDAGAAGQAARRVAELLAAELGRDALWVDGQCDAFDALAAGYRMTG